MSQPKKAEYSKAQYEVFFFVTYISMFMACKGYLRPWGTLLRNDVSVTSILRDVTQRRHIDGMNPHGVDLLIVSKTKIIKEVMISYKITIS